MEESHQQPSVIRTDSSPGTPPVSSPRPSMRFFERVPIPTEPSQMAEYVELLKGILKELKTRNEIELLKLHVESVQQRLEQEADAERFERCRSMFT
tara:strand:- start:528 stop:815 length:288 start_codon:yes stop_codon:yes gene_type:complete